MYYLCMSNKHDPHEAFILERLSRGVMKSQISRELVGLGVTSTPDQLTRWLQRRAARIQSNAELVNPRMARVPAKQAAPTAASTGTSAQPTSTPTPATAASTPTGTSRNSSISAATTPKAASGIDQLIEQAQNEPGIRWNTK